MNLDIRNITPGVISFHRITPAVDSAPEGWREIKSAHVFEKDGRLLITATPDDAYPGFEDDDENHPHHCDAEGCGWDHVVADGKLRRLE